MNFVLELSSVAKILLSKIFLYSAFLKMVQLAVYCNAS